MMAQTGEPVMAVAGPVGGASGGDPAPAIEELVAEYQDRLLNFVVRLLGSREDAEEIVQDTFAKADRALRRATPEKPIDPTAAWFYTIALNTARNWVRRRRPVTVPVDRAADLAQPTGWRGYGDPEEAARLSETSRQLEAALLRLPRHQRAPIVLRFIEDLSYQEIATVLGCPVGTVKSHVHRGTRRLRRELAEVGYREGAE